MNFQQIPELFHILTTEGLTPIQVNGENFVCKDSSGNEYLMKECRGMEEHLYTVVFPAITQQGVAFDVLELPRLYKIVTGTINGRHQKFILINFYRGTHFNDAWNEVSSVGYGGRGVNPDLSDKVIKLLTDFKKINVAQLTPLHLLTFNLDDWKTKNFPLIGQNLIQNGVITQEQFQQAQSIILKPSTFRGSDMVLTNGDFYPRNFIELPTEKIVVIDWEGRTDYEAQFTANGVTGTFKGQRNALVNYLENHLAFFFVHMWGNYPVQRKILKSAAQKFHINKENIQVAIIIKSLEQALAFNNGFLAIRQAETFVNALNMDYVDDLLR
ncbi:MAG TPA: hypothetical protein ACFYEK_17450 [Candidatus Wunengus sp. YC60]|uniref:hypothetical protein n=1 Tax=Candidatus Wunengus sp. YC60 TaxID=3367697 RepID=UPI00402531F7